MRFERLDLLSYGCFKNKSINFPTGKTDLHIIFGPNEAGKSTALSAIEDLLFGIPKSTSYGFLFDNKDLRIGAVINNGTGKEPICFRRRKGNKDTFLNENENTLPDNILNELLQGVDRSFFERMFSLGHERLRKGGQEILDEKDDVGRMLFSASAGLLGLAEGLKKIEGNADQLWDKRKSGKRLYYQAQEKYEDAEHRKKEATILTKNWKDYKNQLEKTTDEHVQQNRVYAEKTMLQEKLERIRRTLPYLGQIKKLEEDIVKIGSVFFFSEDAASILHEAEKNLNQAEATLKTLNEQIEEAKNGLGEIVPDEQLLGREVDIKKLERDRAIVEKHERDIPNRQAEIKTLETRCGDLAVELGWPKSKINQENFFPQTLFSQIEKLVKEKVLIDTRLKSAEDALHKAELSLATLKDEIVQIGEAPKITPLETAIRIVRSKGDLQTEIARYEDEVSGLNRRIEVSLESLLPWQGSIEQLQALSVPQIVTIEAYNKELTDLINSQKENEAAIKRLQGEWNELKLERNQLIRDKQAIAPELLEEARQHRNRGWNIIKRKYIDDVDVPEDEMNSFSSTKTVSEAYVKAVDDADSMADKRFASAEETATLAKISNTIEKLEHKINLLTVNHADYKEQQDQFNERWDDVWSDCGFKPLNPQEMLGWMDSRKNLLLEQEQKVNRVRQVERIQVGIEEAKELLINGLSQVGSEIAGIKDQSVHLLIEHADVIRNELDRKATRIEALQSQILGVENQRDDAKEKSDAVAKEKEAWGKMWRDALEKAGFSLDSSQEVITFYLSSIKEIKEAGQEISKIRTTRIETMERDIENFNKDLEKLSDELSLRQGDDKETVYSLVGRLEEERGKNLKKKTKQNQCEDLQQRNIKFKQERKSALAQLEPLFEMAKTEDLSVLREKIESWSRFKVLKIEKEEALTALRKQGDGKNREELEQECADKDSDRVKADLDILRNELQAINETLQELSQQKIQAKTELDKISGKADAAGAEVDRQFALTDMGMAAERYVRMQTAAILLRWGMEKFRKEKQGPLLEGASKIFRVLTLDSFSKLMVNLDDNDKRYLAGMRSNETHVEVDGMSDGTVDQLYLALRLAAIEEYVQKSQSLPFVADDLFINFDDSRAAAGFKTLMDLSQKTQVLFFTHHEHLINVAKQALPQESFVVHKL